MAEWVGAQWARVAVVNIVASTAPFPLLKIGLEFDRDSGTISLLLLLLIL